MLEADDGVDFDVVAYYRMPTPADYEAGVSNEFDQKWIYRDWNEVMEEASRVADNKRWSLSGFIDWLADEYSGGSGLDNAYEFWNALKQCKKEGRDGYE